MKKIYYLSTCDKCREIIKRLGGMHDFEKQDIKTESITEGQLDHMKKLTGSYEDLFSRRAIKYKEMNLKEQDLKEKDFKRLILNEYTFLKRPVIIIGDQVFVGSDKKMVDELEKIVKTKKLGDFN
jgi:arsenate reductase-like glutaredoxin family protein